jgi:hypothetical protein
MKERLSSYRGKLIAILTGTVSLTGCANNETREVEERPNLSFPIQLPSPLYPTHIKNNREYRRDYE